MVKTLNFILTLISRKISFRIFLASTKIYWKLGANITQKKNIPSFNHCLQYMWFNGFIKIDNKVVFHITSTWNNYNNLTKEFWEYVSRSDSAMETYLYSSTYYHNRFDVFNIKFYTILCTLIESFFISQTWYFTLFIL